MTDSDPKLVQALTPFPESQLWEIQRQYFRHQGMDAWDKEVPNYITSNSYIGRLYAEQCLAFIQDWRHQHPHQKPEFTVLEIASGTGQFAFYFLTAFYHLVKALHLEAVQLHFIMTDLVEKNIHFCEKNPVFKPYIEANQLDFGVFDTQVDTDVMLRHQKKKLSECLPTTPLIVVSNYALDFIKQDVFRFEKGKVEKTLIEIKSRYKDFDTEKVAHLNELSLSFQYQETTLDNYYEDPTLNAVLKFYDDYFKKLPDELDEKAHKKAKEVTAFELMGLKGLSDFKGLKGLSEFKGFKALRGSAALKKSTAAKKGSPPDADKRAQVSIPLGAIQFFNTLDTLTKGQYFAIVGDKGLATAEEIALQTHNTLCTYDGVYTFLVNFHALESYLQQKGGDAFLSKDSISFKVNLFFKGFTRDILTQTHFTYQERMEKFTPVHYTSTYDDYFAYSYRFNYQTAMGFLRLSEWDPIAYNAIHSRLLELMPEMTELTKSALLRNVLAVEARLYPIKTCESTYLLVGAMLAECDQTDKAIALCQYALGFYEKSKTLNHNLAVLYDKQKNPAKAIIYYERALALEPRNRYARQRLEYLTGKLSAATFLPYLKALVVFACLGVSFYILTK